jgi:hypothetical protein
MAQQDAKGRAKRLRRKAAECLRLAASASLPETRRLCKGLALSYVQLAAQAEKSESYRPKAFRSMDRGLTSR